MGINIAVSPRTSLQLGKWDVRILEEAFNAQQRAVLSYSQRVVEWLDLLTGTPFEFESSLAIAEDAMLINLASFDCITFAYHVIALSGASSFDDYVHRLYRLRYVPQKSGEVSNDGQFGNIIDFACESLLINGIEQRMLLDITASLGVEVEHLSMALAPVNRPKPHDAKRTLVFPRYPDSKVETSVIPSSALVGLDADQLEDGDLVVFTQGIEKGSVLQPTFVCHVGFISKTGSVVGMVHATRNYSISKRSHSFPVLEGTDDCYLPGVSVAGLYLGDETIRHHQGRRYYGYNLDSPRPLSDYASNFFAVKFFRLVG